MGNYQSIEIDFIERTLNLINQYETIWRKFPFSEQYNITLLVNCLLGIIIVPKETNLGFIPNDRLTKKLLNEIGLENSYINTSIITLRDLIINLRHSIAHFNIEVISDLDDDNNIINSIKFSRNNDLIANINKTDLLAFVRYFAYWQINNIKKHKK